MSTKTVPITDAATAVAVERVTAIGVTAIGVTTAETVEAAIRTRREPATIVGKRDIPHTTVPLNNDHEETLINFLDPRYESADMPQINDSNIPDSNNNFNFMLAELKKDCPPQDLEFFTKLDAVQNSIIQAGYKPESSIHAPGAIDFSKNILKASPQICTILSEGYLPGK